MEDIAILLTCHNRKDKTLKALAALQKAKESYSNPIRLSIYLTDDGSTDGTAKAIQQYFPNVIILHGDGNLFWAGGMINSWKEAIKKNIPDIFY